MTKTLKISTITLLILTITASTTQKTQNQNSQKSLKKRMLTSQNQRRMLQMFTDGIKKFPKWFQVVVFIVMCLMILGGIAAIALCIGNKNAGPAQMNPQYLASKGMNMGGNQAMGNRNGMNGNPNSSMMALNGNNSMMM